MLTLQRLLLGILAVSLLEAFPASAEAHPVTDDRARLAELRQKEAELAKPPDEFRLSGIDGRSYSLESFRGAKQVTFISVSYALPSCERDSRALVELAKLKSTDDEPLVLVHSGLTPDRTKWVDGWKELGSKVLVLWDPLQILSMRRDFRSPGDHVVVDPAKLQVTSSGKIADLKKRFHSAFALPAEPSDCIERADRGVSIAENPTAIEFQKEFARPFMRTCVRCHVFSRELDYFGTLQEVRGWQAMSLKTIEVGRMPGGFEPNPHGENALGYSLDDVRRVARYFQNPEVTKSWTEKFSDEYLKTYRAELDQQVGAVTKSLGKPDMILQTPEPLKVRSSADLMYRYFNLSEPFTEDRVVRAVTIESDMTVLHHAHVIVVPRKITATEARQLERGASSAAIAFQKLYGPGSYNPIRMTANGKTLPGVRLEQPIAATFSRPFRFSIQDVGEGVKIPKGSSLAVVLHVESVGKEAIEQPKFNVYFAKPNELLREISQFTMTPLELTIPPRKVVQVRSEVEIAEPTKIEKALIHMHYRGASARIFVKRTRESKEELVADLPYHLFKLQKFYRFKDLQLEPGSSLITELVFDNTSRNLANPYPEKSVRIGKASLDDEMHFPRIFYSRVDRWPKWKVEKLTDDGSIETKSVSEIFYDNRYQNPLAFVVIAHGASCPVMRQNMVEFQSMIQTLKKQGARFLIVNSVPQDQTPERRALASRELKEYGITEPLYFDRSQEIIKAVGLKVVGEIAVVRPTNFEVVYQGGISDRVTYDFAKKTSSTPWAKDAITALLKGTEVPRARAPSFGCAITFNESSP